MALGPANLRGAQRDGQPEAVSGEASFAVSTPSLTLPKGGGAIRGIGEKFAANPVTGTGSVSVPIATSPGRSGFGPQLSLSYDSGAGNGPFGFGWSLSLPSIARKTDKGLPQYLDAVDSDVFVLSGAEDLVPVLRADGTRFRDDTTAPGFVIDRYRPRIEGLFARIERWSRIGSPGDVHWRSISKDNILTLYGYDANSRVADPLDADRIFSWLICESRDGQGNGIRYLYKNEDGTYQPRPGQPDPFRQVHQRNRGLAADARRTAQRYLQRVLYGNLKPLLDAQGRRPRYLSDLPDPPSDTDADWFFEVRFDYGELDEGNPTGQPEKSWLYRPDAFSSYRSGFEVRTCRRCERVLMLHHIPDQPAGPDRPAQPGYRGVVCSTEFTYDDEIEPGLATRPVYSFLRQVVQTGWQQDGGSTTRSSMPPVEFEYTEPRVQEVVEEVDPASLANMPVGLDRSTYRWTDLHGEGVPGILTEQAGAWFYKRNWSPIPQPQTDGSEVVKARFAPLEAVALKPNVSLNAGAEFMDLAGDGQPDVVVMEGPTPGLYEHDEATGWQPFRPFSSRLDRDLRDPNLKFVDLDGDGHADVLITEDDALVWHASLAEEGFGPAHRVAQALDEEKGPRVVFADGTQCIYLADLSGDGLTDIVRIRNGDICYWPNLGYGRFGTKVTMDDAPWFDHPDQFDHKRIRLADIDGSGTTDLIYLHRSGVRLYFNQSGNGWSQPQLLKVFPRVDDLLSIVPIDLLGDGTACLVWSSPLPGDGRRAMRYVNLMGGRKPHLLVRTVNNLGAETRVDYAPSTKFYLQDSRDGRPWITRLPFPVHVVERVETYDHISRNRFVTRLAYHHGYFDGDEREFRGFGLVEQWDTEQFAALADGAVPADNVDAASHVPPVHTKTWFHTGLYLGRQHVSDYFAGLLTATDQGEYFREPGATDAQARAMLLPDTELPEGLTLDEEREACRALRGSMLRQEIYADDADHPGATPAQIERARRPYSVTEQNFTIRTLQARGSNRHAVFLTHAREALSYHYERDPADPRIQHTLTLEVDDVGNVLKQAAVGYGRRASPLPAQWDRDRQTTPLLTYTENRVTNAIDSPDAHRNPLPCEAATFELTGYLATGPAGRYQTSDLVEPDPAAPGRLRHTFAAPEVPYESAAAGSQRRRPIEVLRTLYRRDDLTGLLPLGGLQSLALPGESYRLAFTPGLLAQVFQRPREGQGPEPLLPDPAAVLGGQAGNRGGYLQSQELKADGRFPGDDADDHWWLASGQSFFSPSSADDVLAELARARRHFYLPRRYRDPFGQDALVDFDAHDLLMVETRDALNNRVTVDANDYRVLQPRLVSDPNRNRTEVAFDTLGMVAGTAVLGKPLPAPTEGDSLAGFVPDLTQAQLDGFVDAADPHATAEVLLQGATTRIVYNLDRFQRTRQANPSAPERWQPAYAATLARETHVNAPLPPQGLKIQLSFSYSDGFGREIQKKIQAEPGPVPRRDATGKIIIGVDGQPVMTSNDVSPRWVGSGWTVFNNKGKPVRQYEPFFTDSHRFELDARIGVSPVLFYDPAERVVATLHPNDTYEKVVFDPWQQTTYDVNDTCAARDAQTGDPRTDPDIGGYVEEYFKAQPAAWLTWHARRIGNALGTDERNAAERAAAHADTPATAHVDALGRPFLTVARNRVVCAEHDLDGTEESLASRVELDIEGNQRSVRDAIQQAGDPLGRVVMRYAYDMLGNRIHQHSMEAGARWMVNDAAGKPIRAWDSRGHEFTTTYDALRRPVEQTVRGTFSDADPLKPNSDPRTLNRDILVDRIEYGEPPLNATPAQEAEAQRLNLRTRILRHSDSAGIATNARLDAGRNPTEAYDFKGNLLRSTRQLVSDYAAIPDWLRNPQLEAETFEGGTRYDALNRPIQSIAPHSSLNRPGHPDKFNVIQPVFNEANLLERVDVWLERAAEPTSLLDPAVDAPSPVGVADIDYDAKGQRTLIDYRTRDATVIRTTYAYDRETFRLTHLYTRRGVDPATAQGVAFTDDCQNPNPPPVAVAAPAQPPAGKSCGLQNLHYTYDPAGNITHIRDDAQQTVYFRNQRVEPSNDYIYDALYRLIQADSREHLGQAGGAPIPHSPDDASRVGLLHPGDGNAMGTYTERYVYDAVGNFLQMQHRGSDPAHPGWTRAYTYAETSLTEPGKQNNQLTSTHVGSGPATIPATYLHDTHGNMLRMPHLGGGGAGPNMHWDYKDQLRQVDKGGGGAAFYVYDASGQRVRKVWEKAPSLTEERIYLGGFEVFRRHGGPIGANTVTLERETLHLMADKQRIALIETRVLDTAGGDQAPRQLIRYQFGNHLGSATLELDERAQIISCEEYSPYGSSTYEGVRSSIETGKRYRYTGRERDTESGFSYHGARFYSPWLGRWMSCDPIGVKDEPNLFSYCNGNPLNRTDIQGADWEFTWKPWEWEPVAFTKEEVAPRARVFSGNVFGTLHAIVGYETDRELGPYQAAGYEWAQSTFGWQKFEAVQKMRDDIVNDPYASKIMAGTLGLISAFVPGAPEGDDLPESMQRTYKMMKYASTNATMIVGAVGSFQSNRITRPPSPPAVATSTGYLVRTAPGALTTPAPGPLAMAIVAAGNGSPKGEPKSGQAPKPEEKQLKADAGTIHGVDQYRGGQTLLTAELKMPDGSKLKVAVPNEGAGWRPEQREKAVSLGYKPLDARTPGSGIHAEQQLEIFRKEKNATVTEWAISRGKGGNSIICNEGCKNFTKNWGPQQQ
ncbi:RHS repeat-associated core domain-containing protein [Parafrankia irregularis]|uniref:RHS repeat-associated core domain-containing protein n=1 Tax=Parafrankia irregularis TaxID=795642 RepID=A0A0S4QQ02_9ACTN|nr:MULTISPECIES: SpvB/TcaC N-terminal domain-containing protein [Parafrankia]MBE3200235.1 toxin [Parafrankia sp. CH37]CUU56570.1 RHS repeat-associated core domain-containing protein [Parafrankia irregularis]